MRCISEANADIIGNTSETLPPCALIAAASFCTAISCCPNASIELIIAAGICFNLFTAKSVICAPSSIKTPSVVIFNPLISSFVFLDSSPIFFTSSAIVSIVFGSDTSALDSSFPAFASSDTDAFIELNVSPFILAISAFMARSSVSSF